jgi:hypothetical protein
MDPFFKPMNDVLAEFEREEREFARRRRVRLAKSSAARAILRNRTMKAEVAAIKIGGMARALRELIVTQASQYGGLRAESSGLASYGTVPPEWAAPREDAWDHLIDDPDLEDQAEDEAEVERRIVRDAGRARLEAARSLLTRRLPLAQRDVLARLLANQGWPQIERETGRSIKDSKAVYKRAIRRIRKLLNIR